MKNILFMLALMGGLATTASAENKPRPTEELQIIMTDCGTTHFIPANCTEKEAWAWLEYWTVMDCK